jgi:hypothetical protein
MIPIMRGISTLTYGGEIEIMNSQNLYWRLAIVDFVPGAGAIPTGIGLIFK